MFSEIFKDLPPGKRFQWGNPSGAYEGRGVPISKLLEPSNHGVRRWHLLRKTTTISNKRSRVKKKKHEKKTLFIYNCFFLCSVIFLSLCAFASRSQQCADAFGEWRWMRLICGLTGLDSFLLLPFSSSSSFFFSVRRHSAKFKPQLKTVKDNQLAFSSPFWRLYNRIHLRISRSSHHLITKCNNRNIPPTP